MAASEYEQDHATRTGVRIVFSAIPTRIKGNGAVREVEFAYTEDGPGGLVETGETFVLKADQVLSAIGQTLADAPADLTLSGGKLARTGPGRTSISGVWAGGDCASGDEDLTVTAVAEGRDAALDIHATLMGA